MTERRVAVVGMGAMGQMHAEHVRRVPGLELACVVDRDEAIASQAASTLGVPYATSVGDALARDDFEAVIVASPTATHPVIVMQLAGAGRHIFCEKPIGLDLDSTQRAVEAARQSGVILHVGLHRRFDADWQAVRREARSGTLGDINLLRMSQRLMTGPLLASQLTQIGNIFVDTVLHDLDAALWISGARLLDVSAFGGRPVQPEAVPFDHTDTTVVILRFDGGALTVIDVSFTAGYAYECAAELVGTKGAVRIGAEAYADQLEWLVGGTSRRQRVLHNRQHHPAAYVGEIEHFAAALRDEASRESCVDEAIAAFKVAEMAARSFREGRAVRSPDLRARLASAPL